MKIQLMALLLVLNTNAFAATNWNQLVNEVKSAEYENVKVDDLGYVEMRIVKLPNNKIRFMGFNSLGNSTKMKLTIHSSKTDLEKICNDYSLFNKSFAAELTFNTLPISDRFDFVLKDGRKMSTIDFENPFIASEAEAAALSNRDKTPWTLNTGDFKKFKDVGVKIGFANLLNNAIKNKTENIVTVDLSNFNGLACDLASGFIKPTLTKTISYEKALPDSSYWIGQESFSEIFKTFWMGHDLISSDKAAEDVKASELILLGMSLADKGAEKEKVFKSKGRALNLLNSLKFKSGDLSNVNISSFNPVEQWKQTFEYVVPVGNTQTKQVMAIQYGEVFTSILE